MADPERYQSALTGPEMDQALLDMANHTSERFAKGTANGVAVEAGTDGYNDNSLYYKNQAANQVQLAANQVSLAKAQADLAANAADRAEAAVPVGTQSAVLFTTAQTLTAAQQAQARANIMAGGSNPNLLDNPWFTVNQRGQTEYTQVAQQYSLDRWRWLGGNTGKMQVNSPYGITMWQSDTTRGNFYITQRMANSEALYGKTLTISVNIDGTIYAYTGTCPSIVTSSEQLFIYRVPITGMAVRLGLQPTGYVQADIATSTDIPHVINAVKVELGSYSTLANDAPPNYAVELAKCQRYFLRVTGSASLNIAYGMTFANGTSLRALIPTPTTMRSAPSISRSGTIYVRGEGGLFLLTGLTVIALQSNGIVVEATSSSTYTGNAVYGLWGESGSYINLSADL